MPIMATLVVGKCSANFGRQILGKALEFPGKEKKKKKKRKKSAEKTEKKDCRKKKERKRKVCRNHFRSIFYPRYGF